MRPLRLPVERGGPGCGHLPQMRPGRGRVGGHPLAPLEVAGLLGIGLLAGPSEAAPPPCDRQIVARLQLGHYGPVTGCAWSPDGSLLLSASYDHTLKVWDAATGDCLLSLSGHSRPVMGCAWSPDGQQILACFNDGSVSVFGAALAETALAEIGPRCYHLAPPHCAPTWASVDLSGRVLKHGEDAWRYVGCVLPDQDGLPHWVPLEALPPALSGQAP